MRIGGAILVLAFGAILKFAVNVKHTHGIDINTIGVILMIVGALWLVAEIIYASTRRRTDVVHHDAVGRAQSTTYVDPPADYR